MTSPIPDRAALEGLLEMVRMATGPDRKLDSALMRYVVWVRANDEEIAHALAEDDLKPFTQRRHDADAVPRLTGSIDAAVALVERVLPGWPTVLTTMPMAKPPSRYVAKVIYVPPEEKAWGVHHEGGGANMALALCAALLTALLAQSTP